ncbi:MAG TPA: GDCCVxC domain-containing (seleno)protein [Rhodanobacter sp.]|nr:GDCCVxC domain-containing (seleno)protein [Rhodanobacter sp.]
MATVVDAGFVRASTLTCPRCGHASRQAMPTDACQWFWECPACHEVLRPKPGDCCVFCSYGDVPCPSVQQRRARQAAAGARA